MYHPHTQECNCKNDVRADGAKTPSPTAAWAGVNDLGGHVEDGADALPGRGELERLGEAEVADAGPAVEAHHEVL